MLVPLIPARLHGWLDEFATASYWLAAFLLDFEGLGFWLLLVAGAFHFANTRLTDYPQGQLKMYSLATHAKLEFVEGVVVLVACFAPAWQTPDQRMALAILGGSQLLAAVAGDTRAKLAVGRA